MSIMRGIKKAEHYSISHGIRVCHTFESGKVTKETCGDIRLVAPFGLHQGLHLTQCSLQFRRQAVR